MITGRLGIFGGTFDPPHLAHLKIARLVQKRFKLDQIIFVPAGQPPHKDATGASKRDRWMMTQLAFSGQPGFSVSDFEIKQTSPSYSITTLRYFRKQFENDELFFIVGLDSLLELRTWHQPEKILKLADLIVVHRPGVSRLPVDRIVTDLSLSEFKRAIHYLKIRGSNISSTKIRNLVAGNQPFQNLVPRAVAEYITQKNLYS